MREAIEKKDGHSIDSSMEKAIEMLEEYYQISAERPMLSDGNIIVLIQNFSKFKKDLYKFKDDFSKFIPTLKNESESNKFFVLLGRIDVAIVAISNYNLFFTDWVVFHQNVTPCEGLQFNFNIINNQSDIIQQIIANSDNAHLVYQGNELRKLLIQACDSMISAYPEKHCDKTYQFIDAILRN